MNFYKHHIGDYDQATRHLSFVEDAAYCRLIRKYYAEEGPLPSDVKKVQKLIAARTKEEKSAVESVLEEFFVLEDDGWHQKRCDEELEAARIKAERNRQVGKLGGRPKKSETQEEPTENPDGYETETQTVSEKNPSQTPDTNKTLPHTPRGGQNLTDEKADKPKRSAVGLLTYLQSCKQSGKKPIAEGDAVFAYAEQAGIPLEYLRLHWLEFKARYGQPDAKRYKDWPSVHRKSVRGNWFRLWFIAPDGAVVLTTVGEQARRVHGDAA